MVLYFVYSKYDFKEIKTILSKGINYKWLLFSMIAGLISHYSRTVRWKMLIDPLGKKPNVWNTFFAVMTGYFANLLIPRMGEISRCGVLSKYEKISVTGLIGTVVTERLTDVIMLLLSLAMALILQFRIVSNFLNHKTDLSGIKETFSSPAIYIYISLFILLLVLLRKYFASSSFFKKLDNIWKKFVVGLMSIKKIRNIWSFLFHTLIIWIMYFLMIYLCFFSFNFTENLNPLAGLTVFVLGSLGMVAPVQGGMGPWHFMVIAALGMYGINETQGATFALVVWSSLNIMIVLMGILSLTILPLINKQKK